MSKTVTKHLFIVMPDGKKVRRSTTTRTEGGGILHVDNLIWPPNCLQHVAEIEVESTKQKDC